MGSKTKKITFITGNPAKAKYLSDYFDYPIEHKSLDLPEIQSMDLEQIVADKAISAYEVIKSPVLVEDVSLSFDELNGLPGPLIRWFCKTIDNDGMCKIINDNRKATAKVAFCYYDGEKSVVFNGEICGIIAESPRGENNFGWDPIFIPEDHTETWAEMSPDEKHETSMRKIALAKLKEYLESNK